VALKSLVTSHLELLEKSGGYMPHISSILDDKKTIDN
jgi:hypothetical protein